MHGWAWLVLSQIVMNVYFLFHIIIPHKINVIHLCVQQHSFFNLILCHFTDAYHFF